LPQTRLLDELGQVLDHNGGAGIEIHIRWHSDRHRLNLWRLVNLLPNTVLLDLDILDREAELSL
jgi:hypothetical protein